MKQGKINKQQQKECAKKKCLTESNGRNTAKPPERIKVETGNLLGARGLFFLPFLTPSLSTSATFLYFLLLFLLQFCPPDQKTNDHLTSELYTSVFKRLAQMET